jgi:hypothetical protein
VLTYTTVTHLASLQLYELIFTVIIMTVITDQVLWAYLTRVMATEINLQNKLV